MAKLPKKSEVVLGITFFLFLILTMTSVKAYSTVSKDYIESKKFYNESFDRILKDQDLIEQGYSKLDLYNPSKVRRFVSLDLSEACVRINLEKDSFNSKGHLLTFPKYSSLHEKIIDNFFMECSGFQRELYSYVYGLSKLGVETERTDKTPYSFKFNENTDKSVKFSKSVVDSAYTYFQRVFIKEDKIKLFREMTFRKYISAFNFRNEQ